MVTISFTLTTLAILLALPVAVFFTEILAAVTLRQRNSVALPDKVPRGRIAVLVPAHNESTGLLPTLADIKAQLRADDRLLVVADNCSDDTAAVATTAGADVIDRHDSEKKGKGYALAYGLRHFEADPPDIIIVIDADCRLGEAAIERLAATCALTHRPVQALYIMAVPEGSSINFRIAEFASRVFNRVRPLGLRALGLPCQLLGTGMAFPWDVITLADLAQGSIVEDLKLGLDLALAGHPPIFCPSAIVTSHFPSSVEGAHSQRTRWESGHIGMIFTMTPRLMFAAIMQRNLDILALAFDVAVPPLSLLGMLATGILVLNGVAIFFGISSTAMLVSTISFVALIGGVFLSWLKYGRDIPASRFVLLVLAYVLRKLPLYRKILSGKSNSQWIRTDRTKG